MGSVELESQTINPKRVIQCPITNCVELWREMKTGCSERDHLTGRKPRRQVNPEKMTEERAEQRTVRSQPPEWFRREDARRGLPRGRKAVSTVVN